MASDRPANVRPPPTKLSRSTTVVSVHFGGLLQVSSTKRTPSTTTPTFDKESAESYFQEVYDASSHSYTRPDWLPESPPPTTAFNEDPISRSEVEEIIKHMRSTFSASPLDQVSHRALKHCPSLMPALIDLYIQLLLGDRICSPGLERWNHPSYSQGCSKGVSSRLK